jgi:hypothetical protein
LGRAANRYRITLDAVAHVGHRRPTSFNDLEGPLDSARIRYPDTPQGEAQAGLVDRHEILALDRVEDDVAGATLAEEERRSRELR